MQTTSGATNQGFLDLHNQTGMIAVMAGFVIVFLFIAVGAAFAKAAARHEQAEREELRRARNQSE
jgi:hypothetical protein